MKIRILSLIALLTIGLFSCNTTNIEEVTDVDTVKAEENIYPNTKTFYKSGLNGDNAAIIAESIIYDVNVTPIEGDEWSEYSLKGTNTEALENIIFHAIYNGRLTAYSYKDEDFFGEDVKGNVISIEEVKAFEKEYKNNPLAKIEFKEDWYFDEETLKMGKEVKSVIFGYKQKEKIGYRALFKVYLDKEEI